jgi:two-component system, NtrC family, response regulator GlrR
VAQRLLLVERSSLSGQHSLSEVLTPAAGFSCESIDWEALLPERLQQYAVALIVAVAEPLTAKVMRVFEWLRANPIGTPTLAVLPHEADASLLQAASETADDFMFSPIRTPELHQRIARILGPEGGSIESIRWRMTEEMGLAQLVGNDPAFVHLVEQLPSIARSDVPVLITGETGTGKELFARAIHFVGKRRSFPFIAVDCGALPDHLIENELFGHARGAYTDAHQDQRGLIAMAEGGTLFLDEIDALSLTAQAKLLRFLQEHSFRSLGSDRFVRANINVIAATNRDLDASVRDKQFRSDLYFRLNVLRVHLPPLRERRGDVGLLATHFLAQVAERGDHAHKRFSPAALRALEAHDWPGNVRELFNVVQRAVALSAGVHILPEGLAMRDPFPLADISAESFRAARADAVATFERRYVEDLLRKHQGNVTRAARDAHKDRRAFGRLVKKYGIDRASFS